MERRKLISILERVPLIVRSVYQIPNNARITEVIVPVLENNYSEPIEIIVFITSYCIGHNSKLGNADYSCQRRANKSKGVEGKYFSLTKLHSKTTWSSISHITTEHFKISRKFD
jgi:hypothetical protein